jgi:hypothetical protein
MLLSSAKPLYQCKCFVSRRRTNACSRRRKRGDFARSRHVSAFPVVSRFANPPRLMLTVRPTPGMPVDYRHVVWRLRQRPAVLENKTAMILTLNSIHWLSHAAEQSDLCAHGEVTVQIGSQKLASPADGDWCVSAAALYLLRTLTTDHTPEHPVGEHLIPHCGHTMFVENGSDDVLILGCPQGVNWDVIHQSGQVLLRTTQGTEERLRRHEWQQAVLAFADAVEHFYAHSLPKVPADTDEAAAYAVFLAEWKRRRQAISVAQT